MLRLPCPPRRLKPSTMVDVVVAAVHLDRALHHWCVLSGGDYGTTSLVVTWLFTMHPLVFYFPPFVIRRATASRALVLAVTGRGLFRRAFGGHLRKANRHLWSQCYWFFMLWWVQLQVWWVKWSLCYGISPAVCNLCDAYDVCVWRPALVWH